MACVIKSAYDRFPHAFLRDEFFLEAILGDVTCVVPAETEINLIVSKITFLDLSDLTRKKFSTSKTSRPGNS